MSGETEIWNVQALKQHYDKLREADQTAIKAALVSQEKAVAAALAAAKEAVTEAKVYQDQQLKSHNGLIKKMETQTASFLPRPEYDVNHKALQDKIDARYEALGEKIDALTIRVAAMENRSSGMKDGWKILTGVIATGAAIVGIILAFNN